MFDDSIGFIQYISYYFIQDNWYPDMYSVVVGHLYVPMTMNVHVLASFIFSLVMPVGHPHLDFAQISCQHIITCLCHVDIPHPVIDRSGLLSMVKSDISS